MIRPDEIPERYEFGHALVCQAVYDTLNPSRQARLHRRLARELEAARTRVPACTDPAEIVSHYASSRALPAAPKGHCFRAKPRTERSVYDGGPANNSS